MELGIRELFIALGVIVVIAILFDCVRRIRRSRYSRIRTSRRKQPIFTDDDVDEFGSELPGGPARVVGVRDSCEVEQLGEEMRKAAEACKPKLSSIEKYMAASKAAAAGHQSVPAGEVTEASVTDSTISDSVDSESEAQPKFDAEFLAGRETHAVDPVAPQSADEEPKDRQPHGVAAVDNPPVDAESTPEPTADTRAVSYQATSNVSPASASETESDTRPAALAESQSEPVPELTPEPEAESEAESEVKLKSDGKADARPAKIQPIPVPEQNDLLLDIEQPKSHKEINASRPPEEVIIFHVVAKKGLPFSGQALLNTLMKEGLRYGSMKIFHRHEHRNGSGDVLFSMANIVEPGTFDLAKMSRYSTSGVSFFIDLASVKVPSEAFALMLEAIATIIEDLGGILQDETRSTATRQTIEHYRQRVKEFERRSVSTEY